MPMTGIRNFLIIAGFSMGLMAVPFSAAQAQLPKQTSDLAEQLKTMMPQAVPQDKAAQEVDEAEGTGGFSDIERTPRAEAETQQDRQIQREKELTAGGFAWQHWSKIGEPTLKFIRERDPKEIGITGSPKYRDFAVADIDKDNLPDVVVYDWTNCVAAGCQFQIYFNNTLQKPVGFLGRQLKPFKNGVSLDGTYYEF